MAVKKLFFVNFKSKNYFVLANEAREDDEI